MAQKDDTAKAKRFPWLKIALAGSLALNLLIVGFLAGSAARQMGNGGALSARSPGLGAFGAPYMIALPQDNRRDVLRALRETRGEALPDRRARREMFVEVVGLIQAQPFDIEVLSAAVARQAETTVSVQKRAQSAWLNVVANMTDAERESYAAAVEEVLGRKPKR
ncbi:MAG: periplasmic heavy metal sensor [Roseobacter sp.]|jgi:uncharacterized membrane protein|nr:periplasmic heavy metal sensor [Roseobacter sp.]